MQAIESGKMVPYEKFRAHIFQQEKEFFETKIDLLNRKIVELNSLLELEGEEYDENEIKKDLEYAHQKTTFFEQKLDEQNYQIFMIEQKKLPKMQREFRLARMY